MIMIKIKFNKNIKLKVMEKKRLEYVSPRTAGIIIEQNPFCQAASYANVGGEGNDPINPQPGKDFIDWGDDWEEDWNNSFDIWEED